MMPLRSRLRGTRLYYVGSYFHPSVRSRSSLRNIYQINMVRTASTWLARMLKDPRVYLATGLKTYNYQTYLPGHADARGTTYRPFARPMPPRCIAMLYNDRESFAVTPKPGQWRAVAVTRDPRDLLVSWFFAFKFSHQLQGDTPRLRRILTQTDEEDGLLFGIQHLEEVGIFNALRSWSVEELFGGRVMVVPYERLTGPEQGNSVRRLFRHLEIPMGEAQVRQLLTDHSFRARTGGRAQGREDVHAHYRKGTPGDWESHFTGQVLDTFKAATGDLVEVMGYSWDHPQFPPIRGGEPDTTEEERE